jgi:ABC-type lipoprotein export system ATPase subunit
MGERVLVLEGVCKSFRRGVGGRDRLVVLDDVSLAVEAGRIVAVVAPRAEGKTTLLGVAAGMLRVDRGSVRVCGRELTECSDKELSQMLRSEIGLARRDGPELRIQAWDYVAGPLVTGWRWWRGWRERRRLVARTLEDLGVADCGRLWWDELSRWEQVRVEFAAAIVTRPKLLLVDDVIDGLGVTKTKEAMSILQHFAEDLGCAVLMGASDQPSALRSDEVWRLDRAKLKLIANLTENPDVSGELMADLSESPDVPRIHRNRVSARGS